MAGLTPTPVRAAGGHHSVDDAALLDPQQCQLETWADRERGGTRTLLHAGPACRVGPFELGLNLDRVRLQGSGTTHVGGVQVKWGTQFGSEWSAGVVLAAARQDRAPKALGSSLVVPLTWQVSTGLLAHVNLGRDFRPGQSDSRRAGLAVEWAPSAAWTGVAEVFREGGANFRRFGVRWSATPNVSVDLSQARGLNATSTAWWSLGLNWVLD